MLTTKTDEMSQIYPSIFQRIVGSSGTRVLRQAAPKVERAVWKRTFLSSSQLSKVTRPTTTNSISKLLKLPLRSTRRPFSKTSRLRDAKPTPKDSKGPTKEEPTGISARLKKLSREYGWASLGVYLALTVLDFPFCFLLVRSLGTDRIG